MMCNDCEKKVSEKTDAMLKEDKSSVKDFVAEVKSSGIKKCCICGK